MRVIVNQTTSFGLKAGIGHYTDQLLRCLREQAGEDHIDTFPTGWVRRAAEVYARARPSMDRGCDSRDAAADNSRSLPAQLRNGLRKCLYQGGQRLIGWHFRMICARENYDLYHEPNFIPLPCDRPTLATLHDLSLLLHPEWHPAERAAYFARHLPRALDQCRHFLTDSETIRREAIQVLGIPAERVTHVPIGIRPGIGPLSAASVFTTLVRLGLPARYLLYVGTIEPRKNLLPLLRTYCSLPERLRERWPLLLAGRWGWNARATAEYLADVARHRGVIHLGYLADEYLPALYNGARALVYPSHYEGFGLPPLEMMACGGAVLASTAGTLVETLGGQAHLIPADDDDGWRAALIRVVTDNDWWQSLRRGAEEVARPYSWERCAEKTWRVYQSMASRERERPECGESQGRRSAA